MSSSQAVPAKTECYKDGLAFRFKLPEVGYDLIGADINSDGVPSLRFGASHKVPTLTEEDIAVCTRLVQDGKRPGFYYLTFFPNHPLYPTGRFFKMYDPPYLRDTSVGESLAEADWIMKCLHVGVLSNETKTQFRLRNSGFATRCDFFENAANAIMMECKSVNLAKTDNAIVFDRDQPKMRIHVIGLEGKYPYSDYMTTNFDSVAYEEAPVYYKVKEIIKLVLCLEWMKEKGVQFSKEWVMEKTVKSKPSPPLTVAKTSAMSQETVQSIINQLDADSKNTMKLYTYGPNPVETKTEKSVIDNCLHYKFTTTSGNVECIFDFRATIDNFDMLCHDIDPNIPVNFFNGLVIPNVKSWAELYSETVPQPSIWFKSPEGEETPPITGGVTTHNIPVHTKVPSAVPQRESVSIPASKSRNVNKLKRSNLPSQQEVVNRPFKHAKVDKNREHCSHQQLESQKFCGCSSGVEMERFSGQGTPDKKQKAVMSRTRVTIQDNSTPNGPQMTMETFNSYGAQCSTSSGTSAGAASSRPSTRKIPALPPENLPVHANEPPQQKAKGKVSPTESKDSGLSSVDQHMSESTNMKTRNAYDNPLSPSGDLPVQEPAQSQADRKGSPTGSEDSGLGSVDQHMSEPPGMEVDQPAKSEEHSMSDSGILSPNSDLQSLASECSGESSGEETVVEEDD